jgi:hypothetical protein
MMEEELIKIWQSSPNQERIKFEKSRLMIEMQSSMDRLDRAIKYRDLREYLAIAIVIPAFAVSAFVLPSLLSKVASVLIIGWAIYIGFKLRDAKKKKPSAFSETYLDYLHKTREYLLVQKQMLDSVIYWYILPGISLTMLFFLGFGITGRIKSIVNFALGNIALAVATYYINKRAVKTELAPRLKKINELIRLLEKAD